MILKKEFTFPSRNGKDTCHAYSWVKEDCDIIGVFQIIHGMQEHAQRYDAFARFLAENGFLVVAEDHLGHGHTAATDADLGYFGEGDIPTILVRDVHRLKKIIQEQNPGKPYFILGHSMGSFILRKYLAMYKKGIDGAMILGTATKPAIVTGFGIFTCNLLKLFHGDRYYSRFITGASFGSYLKKFPNANTSSDWLTDDPEVIRAYRADKYCGFKFSINGFKAIFQMISYVCKSKNFKGLSKDMPILVAAGNADPVGDYGKAPVKVYNQFCDLGIKDVELKLYKDCRHEIITALNKDEVYNDLLDWCKKHITE